MQPPSCGSSTPRLQKQREQIHEIIAVPPFLNASLTHDLDHMQAAYARLIEQLLLDRPGVLVVELSEAKAIAQEIFFEQQPGHQAAPLAALPDGRVPRGRRGRKAAHPVQLETRAARSNLTPARQPTSSRTS